MHFCSFWAKYWPSDPFGAIPDQKNNANEVPRVFFYMLVPKPKNWSKICMFGHFGPNIGIFCPFRPMPDQKPMRTRCLGGFSFMWVTKLLISPVKKGFFAQKRPNLAQIGISEHCWLIWCPVDGSVGGCGARAVSRKTPIYFMYSTS